MTSKPPGLLSIGSALLALLGGAAPSGLLVPGAEASSSGAPPRRREDEDFHHELLLVEPSSGPPVLLAGHRSHRSHSSHRSHYSGSGGGSRGGYVPSYEPPAPPRATVPSPPPVRRPDKATVSEVEETKKSEPPARAPPTARVSFAAFPGGRIFVDDKAVGQDVSGSMVLTAGTHVVRVENRFLGQITVEVDLLEGQTGEVKIEW